MLGKPSPRGAHDLRCAARAMIGSTGPGAAHHETMPRQQARTRQILHGRLGGGPPDRVPMHIVPSRGQFALNSVKSGPTRSKLINTRRNLQPASTTPSLLARPSTGRAETADRRLRNACGLQRMYTHNICGPPTTLRRHKTLRPQTRTHRHQRLSSSFSKLRSSAASQAPCNLSSSGIYIYLSQIPCL
jgi:hypothetical protein